MPDQQNPTPSNTRPGTKTKRGLLELLIGAVLIAVSYSLGGWAGWGLVVLLPFLAGGFALIGIGIIDVIVGLVGKPLQWGLLLTLRALGAIAATSWLFFGSK